MDDDLTPVEPEFREEPPKTPPEDPNYYGTGRQPQPKKSHLPLILALCVALLAANLLTVIVALTRDEEKPCDTETIGLLIPEGETPTAIEPEVMEMPPLLDKDMSLQGIYDAIAPSTVVVVGEKDYEQYVYTGIILTDDGYLMTSADAGGKELTVNLKDGRSYEASYVGLDGDTILLKIDADDLTAVPMNRDESRRVQKVIQSVRNREEDRVHLELKVSDLPEPLRILYELPDGVVIEGVVTTSEAYKAGLRRGDVLLQIGQRRIWDIASYLDALQHCSWGDTVRIYVYRDGQSYYTDVRLEKKNS